MKYSERIHDYIQQLERELDKRNIDFEMYPWCDGEDEETCTLYDDKVPVRVLLTEIQRLLRDTDNDLDSFVPFKNKRLAW